MIMAAFLAIMGVVTIIGVLIIAIIETRRMDLEKTIGKSHQHGTRKNKPIKVVWNSGSLIDKPISRR